MSEDKQKFWTMLFLVILGVSVVILAIDFSIKGAILEESTRLREAIGGQSNAGRTDSAVDTNGSINPAVSNNLQRFNDARMEKASANGGNNAAPASRFSPEPPDDSVFPSSNE